MKLSRVFVLLVAPSAVSLTACGEGDSGDPFEGGETPLSVEALRDSECPPPCGTNGQLPACFWDHGSQEALRTLGGAALNQGGNSLPNIPLSLVPESCRQVIQSAVECALSDTQFVDDPVTGVRYDGWWGVASSWRTSPLSSDGRRYVTACMLQRLNATGTHVPILLEGPHPAIAENATYDPLYPIEESTAFGDLFSSATPLFSGLPAFNAYVCWEDLLPQSCGLLGLPLLFEERVCDDVPLCGLITLGPCSLHCAPNGEYRQCKQSLLSPWWTQTVRVQLQTADCD